MFTLKIFRYQKDLERNKELKLRVSDLFKRVGLVYLVNTGTNSPQVLRKPFEHILGGGATYEGGANPRRYIEPNIFETGVSNEVRVSDVIARVFGCLSG